MLNLGHKKVQNGVELFQVKGITFARTMRPIKTCEELKNIQ